MKKHNLGGLKLVVTMGSLLATLMGWGAIARDQSQTVQASNLPSQPAPIVTATPQPTQAPSFQAPSFTAPQNPVTRPRPITRGRSSR